MGNADDDLARDVFGRNGVCKESKIKISNSTTVLVRLDEELLLSFVVRKADKPLAISKETGRQMIIAVIIAHDFF